MSDVLIRRVDRDHAVLVGKSRALPDADRAGKWGHENGEGRWQGMAVAQLDLMAVDALDLDLGEGGNGAAGEDCVETVACRYLSQTQVAEVGLGGDESNGRFVAQMPAPQRCIQEERELIGRADVRRSLGDTDDNRAGLVEQVMDGVARLHRRVLTDHPA